MNDSPIFIVGCPRSGTGLLRDLLRSHPRITFPGESHFIPLFYKAYGNPQNEREARKLATMILNFLHVNSFWIKELSLEPVLFSQDKSYSQIVGRIYEAWARKENKPRWGDKTPLYVTEIPILLELFPDGKIIHIYRDGRDVALSWLRLGYRNVGSLFMAAHLWKQFVGAGLRAGKELPRERYMEIRYETLLSQPEEAMKHVCAFLNESFSDAVLKPNFEKRLYRPAIFGERKRPNPASKTAIASENREKWRKEMSMSDRILFESIAGDLLETLGYPKEGKVRQISKAEAFVWAIHHYFTRFFSTLNTKGNYKLFLVMLQTWWLKIRYRFNTMKTVILNLR